MNVSALSPSLSAYGSYTGGGTRASGNSQSGQASGTGQLSEDEQKTVDKLKERDREVRQHEQAHIAAAGGLATSAASFTYQRGPDGKNYAIGGEVGIDVSAGRTPEETISKAQTIRAAALAPADPSGQDRAVAARAAAMAQQAQAELAQQKSQTGGDSASGPNGASAAGTAGSQTADRSAQINRAYTAGAESALSLIRTYA